MFSKFFLYLTGINHLKSAIMSKIFLFVGAIILFGTTSCEGETTRTWSVQNNSSITINVTATTYSGNSTSNSIPANESQVIIMEKIDGGTDAEGIPNEEFSSFLITNATGAQTTKSFQNVENWTSTIEQTKKTPSTFEHQYVFTVSDADF